MNIQYTKGHITTLDGIRGVAILLVLLYHFLPHFFFPLNMFSSIGWVGVDLFLVLSGFLITGILIDSKGEKHYLRNFYAKRTLRIFPLYYFTLAAFFILIKVFKIDEYRFQLDNQLYFWTYTQNLFFAFKGWPENSEVLNHYWSLAIEEQFYLFWPFIILYFDRKNILRVCVSLIALGLLVRNLNPAVPFSYVFTFSRFDALAMGSIGAVLIRYHKEVLDRIIFPLLVFSAASVTFIILYSHNTGFGNPYFVRIGYTLFALFFACIIIGSFDVSRAGTYMKEVFNFTPFKFLGKYSYGLYVYHWLLYKSVYAYLEKRYQLPDICIIPFIILIIIISVVSYHIFESKFLAYKAWFNKEGALQEVILPKNKPTKNLTPS